MKNRKPVALLVNDIHAGSDNLSEFLLNWNEALSVAKGYNVYNIYIGGDLWQSRASQSLDTLLCVKNALCKASDLGYTVTIAEGNHCKVDQNANEGYSHLFKDLDDIVIVDDFICDEYGDEDNPICLSLMGYYPENGSFMGHFSKLKDYLSESYKDKKYTSILYIHEGINGALAKSSEKELPANIFKGFDKVLVGHYHNRVKIEPNIEYIGASRQHNFGEDEEKGYTILYDNGDTEFVKNKVNTRFATIQATPSEISPDLMQKYNDSEYNYKVRVKIECTEDEAADLNRQQILKMGYSKVEVSAKVEVSETDNVEVTEKFDHNAIIDEYGKFCEKNDYEKKLGLKYLEVCGN